MNNFLISLFIAAGVSALVYSQIGKRIGYGNSKNVWTMVAVSFVMSFVVMFILLKTLITLN